MKRYLMSFATMLMMCLLAQSADAATLVQSYRFFVESDGPIASFTGTTSLVIDTDDAMSRVLDFDLTVGDQVFTAANVSVLTVFGGQAVVLRSFADDVLGPSVGHDGFALIFVRAALPAGQFGNTLASEPDNQEGCGSRRVTIDLVADAVPEPATWAMLLIGLAAVGAALRRRPRRAVVNG